MRNTKGSCECPRRRVWWALLAAGALAPVGAVAGPFSWSTVVNNSYLAPGSSTSQFFSYNQPSINDQGVVAFRARAKPPSGGGGGGGAGQPLRGIYTRDMSAPASPIMPVAQSGVTLVPAPNNLGSTFTEFPAFPRIDATSNTIAFRGQSQPVYEYTLNGTDTRAGTSGVYTNPTGPLVTGASQLGAVPGLSQFQVPMAAGVPAGTKFDQFPGAPSPVGNVVAFKGNFTDQSGVGQTGVFYREVGGTSPVQVIAHSGDAIPGVAGKTFGSTAPPSAANGRMVFTGLDIEAAPTAGGIYLAPLAPTPMLTTIARIGGQVPGMALGTTFNAFGEGLSFDGRYVGFWGAWGTETFQRTLACSTDGNADVLAYCLANANNTVVDIPVHQGMFLADTLSGDAWLYAQTGDLGLDDFLFWTYSGRPPGAGESEEGDAEPPRWRASSFLAVDGSRLVFKGRDDGSDGLDGQFVDWLIGRFGISSPLFDIVHTGMDGATLDPTAAGLPIVTLGIERDGFRNGWLAINASMTDGELSQAGIYVARVPEPGTLSLTLAGVLLAWTAMRRRSQRPAFRG